MDARTRCGSRHHAPDRREVTPRGAARTYAASESATGGTRAPSKGTGMRSHPRARGRRSAFALTATGGVLAAIGLAGLGPVGAEASSHREAPLISGMPQYDTTDLYAFRSPDRQNTVTLVANWIPFEEPAGGPNFYKFATDARYDIKIDNDGDTKPDVIYRWTFKDHYRS